MEKLEIKVHSNEIHTLNYYRSILHVMYVFDTKSVYIKKSGWLNKREKYCERKKKAVMKWS